MAVYKPTYCYPYLNAVDIRTAISLQDQSPMKYLTCKIDTSNSNITGYSIRLLDEANNQIFPKDGGQPRISPITELQTEKVKDALGINPWDTTTNSGLNGTPLKIPFFQCEQEEKKIYNSVNAVYYKPKYKVNHLIMDAGADSIAEALFNSSDSEIINSNENISNWNYNSDKGYLVYSYPNGDITIKNLFSLDGETLLNGDTVLVAFSTTNINTETNIDLNQNKAGLWEAYYDDNFDNGSLVLKRVEDFDFETAVGDIIVLDRGVRLHNCTFQCDSVDPNDPNDISVKFSVYNQTKYPLWSAYYWNGSRYSLDTLSLDVGGQGIKWEILLYQGNESELHNNENITEIQYNELQEKYYDIKLSTGTILGSTPERIHIASQAPISGGGYLETSEAQRIRVQGDEGSTQRVRVQVKEIDPDDIYLPASESGQIILQGKFGSLGTGTNEIFGTSRFYVNSYDSSYGHVYPKMDDFKTTLLQQATHCQFFEHSNDPNEIKEQDIVDWGVNINLQLYVKDAGSRQASIFMADETYDQCKFGDQDLILLTEQTDKKQNGIYQYFFDSTGITIGSGVSGIPEGTYHHCIKRIGSYSDWANYIGRIFYCRQGISANGAADSLANQNVESLAPAGTYVLWNPNERTIDDGSPLLFTKELPILLFPQKITSELTFQFYYTGTLGGSSGGYFINLGLIDEQTPNKDDKILLGEFEDNNTSFYNQYYCFVTGIGSNPNRIYVTDPIRLVQSDEDILSLNDKYFYFLSGQNYGKRVFIFSSTNAFNSENPNWDLHTACILRNGPTLTYISPYVNMEPGMALKLSNSKKVAFELTESQLKDVVESSIYTNSRTVLNPGGSDTDYIVTTPWIKVLEYDPKLNYIIHAPLSNIQEYARGIDIINENQIRKDGYYGLASYGDIDDIPWKYEVRSYFNMSNENTFYSIESPYVKILKDGADFTGLKVGAEFITEGGFSIELADSENILYVTALEDQSLLTTRYLNLSAEYRQFNELAWESYRWVLYDENGEILQDTGNKYDGDIEVTFYGLPNEREKKKIYVVLYISDNANNTTCVVIKFTTAPVEDQIISGLDFTATLDKQTHSVLLEVTDAKDIDPDNVYQGILNNFSYYRREYNVYEKPGVKIEGYYYNSKFYSDSEHEIEIIPIEGYNYIDKDTHLAYIYDYEYGSENKKYILDPIFREYYGPWEPVLLQTNKKMLRDYNITADRSYQYIMYGNNSMQIEKGDILNINLDGDGSKRYRVLKNISGTIYELLLMEPTNIIAFNSSDSDTYYKDSLIDKYCNGWYKKLTTTAKKAIKRIESLNQFQWIKKAKNNPTSLNWYTWKVSDGDKTSYYYYTVKNSNLRVIGDTYIRILNIQDIIDYFDASISMNTSNTSLISNKIRQLIKWPIGSTNFMWLMDYSDPKPNNNSYIDKIFTLNYSGILTEEVSSKECFICPLFQIDLSEVSFTKEEVKKDKVQIQTFANYNGKIFIPKPKDNKQENEQGYYEGQGYYSYGDIYNSYITGEPVHTCWNEWSLTELIPEENIVDSPTVKKVYKVNPEQNWLFKFSLETGNQIQNISRSDFQTLGRFLKVGMGQSDYISGEISALLGSELVPYDKANYLERLGKSRVMPLSTNERTEMLKQWRKLIYSKNPKLLKDIKGQNWIVQIFSGSNKPQNFYLNQPDTINFTWKQIEDSKDVVIYDDTVLLQQEAGYGKTPWSPIFQKKDWLKKISGDIIIEGENIVDSTLKVNISKIKPESVSLSYQWYRSSEKNMTGDKEDKIPGANGETYLIKKEDENQYIYVIITATATGYCDQIFKDIINNTIIDEFSNCLLFEEDNGKNFKIVLQSTSKPEGGDYRTWSPYGDIYYYSKSSKLPNPQWVKWEPAESKELSSEELQTGGKIYLRGEGNNFMTKLESNEYKGWIIEPLTEDESISIRCAGNIETLLDYKLVLNKQSPNMAIHCFDSLFKFCQYLTNVSSSLLPATTLASYCYSGMFFGCTGLTTAPELKATTLASYCYSGMFAYCTNLTTAPELPATTLAPYCYDSMFAYCTNLTTAPELKATTLALDCYRIMFAYCTNLTTAPELPATTLVSYCYEGMFAYCTSLYVNDISTSQASYQWVIPTEAVIGSVTQKQPDMFKNCAGDRSSDDLAGEIGHQYIYYTQNKPI